ENRMTNHHLKWVKWAMCMLAVSTWLTGPFSNASQSANHTSKRSDAVAPTCVDNSPAVWFASPTGNDGSCNPHNPDTPMTFTSTDDARPGTRSPATIRITYGTSAIRYSTFRDRGSARFSATT